MYAVQPASYCPIASHFDPNYQPETESITDALSVKYLPLKRQLLSTITDAFVIQNQQIHEAQQFLQNHNVRTSNEGALALAGLIKARQCNRNVGDHPVILLTGALR